MYSATPPASGTCAPSLFPPPPVPGGEPTSCFAALPSSLESGVELPQPPRASPRPSVAGISMLRKRVWRNRSTRCRISRSRMGAPLYAEYQQFACRGYSGRAHAHCDSDFKCLSRSSRGRLSDSRGSRPRDAKSSTGKAVARARLGDGARAICAWRGGEEERSPAACWPGETAPRRGEFRGRPA